jgi:hypothetical protein
LRVLNWVPGRPRDPEVCDSVGEATSEGSFPFLLTPGAYHDCVGATTGGFEKDREILGSVLTVPVQSH